MLLLALNNICEGGRHACSQLSNVVIKAEFILTFSVLDHLSQFEEWFWWM